MKYNAFIKIVIMVAIGLCIWLFYPFLKSFFVALLLITAFSPLHSLLEGKLKKTSRFSSHAPILTASAMTLLLIIVLFLPTLFFVYYIITHPAELYAIGETFYKQASRLLSLAPHSIHWLEKPLVLLNEKVIENQEKIISTTVMNLGDGLLGFMGALGNMVMIVLFFFFLLVPTRSHARYRSRYPYKTFYSSGICTGYDLYHIDGILYSSWRCHCSRVGIWDLYQFFRWL